MVHPTGRRCLVVDVAHDALTELVAKASKPSDWPDAMTSLNAISKKIRETCPNGGYEEGHTLGLIARIEMLNADSQGRGFFSVAEEEKK